MYHVDIPGTPNDDCTGTHLNVTVHHSDGSASEMLIDGRDGQLTVAIQIAEDLPMTMRVNGKQLTWAPEIG